MRRRSILAIIPALLTLSATISCVREDQLPCGIWLEFLFDHNMEYVDSFEAHVEHVDVYLFDEAGRYLLTRHCESEELEEGKRMLLGGLPPGDYTIVSVGGLSDYFSFVDTHDMDFVPGVTTIREVKLSLKHEAASHYFPDLWFGTSMEVRYRGDRSLWQIPLIRQTNRFDIALQHSGTSPAADLSSHTVQIVAPEAGAYDYLNHPLIQQPRVYRPYHISFAPEMIDSRAASRLNAKINTMRLLAFERSGYRLAVLDAQTDRELWSYPLLALLENTKPSRRPDGSSLPLQEYLDRQGKWSIVIVYNGTPESSFAALRVIVNGWIVWEDEMGI